MFSHAHQWMPRIFSVRPLTDCEPGARTRLRLIITCGLLRFCSWPEPRQAPRQNHNALGQQTNAGENIRRLQLLAGD
ncbi:hypothetical protein C660_12896 [Alcaligenes sp. HPC1271]|jgi:hypothetical protein|nr:hypothetical protein C660_12896 [Alcaligenes sp. HPC1271]